MHADCILVVENGVVVESGRHDELLAKGGRYASLYRLQLKEQPAAPEPLILPLIPPVTEATAEPVAAIASSV
jgi:hypothetical protein